MRVSNYCVNNRRISFVDTANITGDNNVDTFHFDFDSEWNDFNYKYLVLIVGAKSYIDPLDENNNALLRSVAYNRDDVTFGVIAKDVPIEENEDIESTVPTLSTNVVWLETIPSIFGQIKEVDGLPDKTVWELYTEEMLALLARGQITLEECQDILSDIQNIKSEIEQMKRDVASDKVDVTLLKAQIEAEITEINQKISAFDASFTEKLSTFNTNYAEKLGLFNQNASDKTEAFDENAQQKTNAFNQNASDKTDAFDNNASSKTSDFNDNASSKTATFNQNAQDKLDAVTGAGTTAVGNIESAESSALTNIGDAEDDAIEHIEQEAESYDIFEAKILESLPKGQPEAGSTFYFDDSSSFHVKSIEVKGKTSQVTTLGKQMFDKSTATYENGKIKNTEGVETSSSASSYCTIYYDVEAETNYTIQGKLVNTTQQSPAIYYYDSNKQWIAKESILNYLDNNKYTFTTPPNCAYIQFQFITAAYNADTVMIEKGSTASDYEPYTGLQTSPSKDYPQVIHNVSGNVAIQKINRNFLKTMLNETRVRDGITITPNGDGTYTVDGTSTSAISQNLYGLSESNLYFKLKNTGVKAGEKYYLTGCPAGGQSGSGYKYELFLSGGSYSYQDMGSGAEIVFNESILNINSYIAIRIASGVTLKNVVFKPMICKSIIDYDARKSESITFPLSQGQKMYEEDYLADDGIHHVWWEDVFDGDETITKSTFATYPLGYAYNIPISKISSYISGGAVVPEQLKCSNFKVVKNQAISMIDGTITMSSSKNKIGIGFEGTAEELQAYLQNNNTTVVYKLEEEFIEPYTEAQQIAWNKIKKMSTYKNITNIMASSDDLAPDLDIVYYKDIETLINRLINENASQGARLDLLEG